MTSSNYTETVIIIKNETVVTSQNSTETTVITQEKTETFVTSQNETSSVVISQNDTQSFVNSSSDAELALSAYINQWRLGICLVFVSEYNE